MSDEREPVILPRIPEPTWIKEAYQRGELSQDEALALIHRVMFGTEEEWDS